MIAGRAATTTGERVSTPAAGFNPTFQRHVAAYRLSAPLLPDGRVLDLGCGVGHSYRELAPRVTVGVDVEPAVLAGQERETHAGDMRRLPFEARSFASVISVQSVEHVPDPESVLAETVRVLEPGGRAVFVTPNRLTFGPPDEIVDPYHYVEFDPRELRALCARFFAAVEILGIHGSERYLELIEAERRELNRTLALDPLRLRRVIPRRARQRLYDWRLRRDRETPRPGALEIGPEDFRFESDGLEDALDLVAVCDTTRA
jgi:SAM-dependent methyltransferase